MTIALLPLTTFALSQVGTPGPANMALMATGARFGLRRALPFVAGVALGKQLIIWPIGFGLMEIAQQVPVLFLALKWISAAYICYLAWRVANTRLQLGDASDTPPGFFAGLIVHPLNPKAWAMITTGLTAFVTADTPPIYATATLAAVLFGCQVILHPLWTLAGAKIAVGFAGKPSEKYLFWTLAAMTVASVFYALFAGDL